MLFQVVRIERVSGSNLTPNMDAASRKAQLVSDRKKFHEFLPKIIDQIIGQPCKETKDATDHYQKVINQSIYLIKHG